MLYYVIPLALGGLLCLLQCIYCYARRHIQERGQDLDVFTQLEEQQPTPNPQPRETSRDAWRDSLRDTLLVNTSQDFMRLSYSDKAVKKIKTQKCSVCKFQNFISHKVCALCHQQLSSPSKKTENGTTDLQKRILKRRLWTRKLDLRGNMYWYQAPNGVSYSKLSPAFVVVIRPSNTLGYKPSYNVMSSKDADASILPTQESIESVVVRRDVVNRFIQAFPDKYEYFDENASQIMKPEIMHKLKLKIHRTFLLEESVAHLGSLDRMDKHLTLQIEFINEKGIDAGALYEEWLNIMIANLSHENVGIFKCVHKKYQSCYLNSNSAKIIGEDHLNYFRAAGLLVGRALLERHILPIHFAVPLLKLILGAPLSIDDVEYYDEELYRNLIWVRNNSNVDALDLTFSVVEEDGGATKIIDLIPGGRDIIVDDDNKEEFIQRKVEYLFIDSVSIQLKCFLEAFYEVVPPELIVIFDHEELNYLLSGSDIIDIQDWKDNSKYSDDLVHDPVIDWFWEIVEDLPPESLSHLFEFLTGSSHTPINGFRNLRSYDGSLCPFTFFGVPLKECEYIRAHACFNRVDLPHYTEKAQLVSMIMHIINDGSYGFTEY